VIEIAGFRPSAGARRAAGPAPGYTPLAGASVEPASNPPEAGHNRAQVTLRQPTGCQATVR
jgi:hypothetical protein